MPRSFFGAAVAGGWWWWWCGGGIRGNTRRPRREAPPGNTEISSKCSDAASAEEFSDGASADCFAILMK